MIKLITFHTPKNYGAVLQAFSLISQLQEYDSQAKVIDYNTPHLRSMYPLMKMRLSLKGVVKTALQAMLYCPRKIQFKKFDSFINKHLPLTERYEDFNALASNTYDQDILFTGSDQVFNPNRVLEERKAFYLNFAGSGAKKISYAASFGVNTVPDEKKEQIATYLSDFSSIAVREESGKSIVESLSNQYAEVVVDPVFLHDRKWWNRIAANYQAIDGRYILYYRLLGSQSGDQLAKKLAQSMGLKLVVISQTYSPFVGRYTLHDVGPEEFLGLYDHADFVITAPFHGEAFSLLYEKQFVFSDTNPLTNERGLHLLEQTGVCQQAYINNFQIGGLINYTEVNRCIEQLRSKGKKYIRQAIQK